VWSFPGFGIIMIIDLFHFLGEELTNNLNSRVWKFNCGHHRFGRLVGVRVGVAYSRNKLALRTRVRNLSLKSQFSIFEFPRYARFYLRFFEVCGR